MKVQGKGCRSCVLPSKSLFFKVKGVKGIHVLGNIVALIYDRKETDSSRIVFESGVKDFYDVEIVSEYHDVSVSNVREYLEKHVVYGSAFIRSFRSTL